MKSWNLSNFEDLSPVVLSSVNKNSSLQLPRKYKRRHGSIPTASTVSAVGAAVLVAAIALTSLQVQVCGSDSELKLHTTTSISNISTNRPPLTLIFGAKPHPLKWDIAKETAMLERAARAITVSSNRENAANVVHAALREELPSDQKDAVDLALLGIKLR